MWLVTLGACSAMRPRCRSVCQTLANRVDQGMNESVNESNRPGQPIQPIYTYMIYLVQVLLALPCHPLPRVLLHALDMHLHMCIYTYEGKYFKYVYIYVCVYKRECVRALDMHLR